MRIKQYDTKLLRITIEELLDGDYITTLWFKHDVLEVDRIVFTFETYGGACDKALDLMFDNMVPDDPS